MSTGTNGILMLFLALADNLRNNSSAEDELKELAWTITPEQATFLARLEAAERSDPKAAG